LTVRFDLLTLHPEMCRGPLEHSIVGRACSAGHIEIAVHDIRAFAEDKHGTADDAPYGGGSGMVMKVDVVDRALESVRDEDAYVVLMAASGTPFTHEVAQQLASKKHLVLLCGHYEGVDERVREHLVDTSVSIGDYVLTGGELAAMVIVDATARLVPGVLGNAESLKEESFSGGLLEYPQYTRPRTYRSWDVPEVLLSGHHERISAWRQKHALDRTREIRPDLLAKVDDVDGVL
jgi:tRNA (guanine37-N1)-methyltransferase